MNNYQRILCAVDLSAESHVVVERAAAIATQCKAQLHLIHVIEFAPIEPMSDSLLPVVQIGTGVLEDATTQLRALAAAAGINAEQVRTIQGSVKGEVLRQARDWHADLIVLGSRERHGLSIAVNLTEDTVLHGAPCDLLVVRLR
jgi:universal stress protein A